jgi:hypothetical protein
MYPVEKIRMTLREYYDKKLERYGADSPRFFNVDLQKLFSNAKEHTRNERASHYITRVREEVIETVERWTGEYKYRVNETINEMIERCEQLNLHVAGPDKDIRPEVTACLTMLVMNKLHTGGYHIII